LIKRFNLMKLTVRSNGEIEPWRLIGSPNRGPPMFDAFVVKIPRIGLETELIWLSTPKTEAKILLKTTVLSSRSAFSVVW